MTNKTQPGALPVDDFLAAVEPVRRAVEAKTLDALFRRVTGFEPVLWGDSLIGYGAYHYRYASGREGDFLATGFSPRKAALSIYIMPGYADCSDILARLGPHRLGKSCLYLTRLDQVDLGVLSELISAGLHDLARHWPVRPRP